MQRVGHVAQNFQDADAYDRRQSRELTPNERIKISRQLQRRIFGRQNPDIREWHRKS